MRYYDTEHDEIITRNELLVEYAESGVCEDVSFDEYIENSLTRNNGTLEIVNDVNDSIILTYCGQYFDSYVFELTNDTDIYIDLSDIDSDDLFGCMKKCEDEIKFRYGAHSIINWTLLFQ